MYIFTVEPVGKPRMTQRDKWKHRAIVDRYYVFKDKINYAVKRAGFRLGNTLDITFHVPMPDSWSKRKREAMNREPHQGKPDLDNMIKAFTDALVVNDAALYEIRARKFWSTEGKIVVYQEPI